MPHKNLIIASAMLLSVTYVNAQDSNNATVQNLEGVNLVRMETIHGTVTVALPSDIEAGDRITGTVIATPRRESDRTAMSAGKITVMGTQVPLQSGTIRMTVPDSPYTVNLKSGEGEQSTTPIPVLPQGTFAAFNFDTFRVPHFCQVGDPLPIRGTFDGSAENTKVSVGGKEVIVLAESPRECVVAVSDPVSGQTEVKVTEGENAGTAQVNLLKINLTAPKLNLRAGERTQLKVEVTGLQGLETSSFPIKIVLENRTPSVIRMEGGNRVNHTVEKSQVNRTGTVTWQITLTGVVPGSFEITAMANSLNAENQYGWNSDADRPVPMDGSETVGEMDQYTIRQLMDTLRDLRARKAYDYSHGRESQKELKALIRTVKGALGLKGVTVDDNPIDDIEE